MDQTIVFHEYEQQKRKKGCILFPTIPLVWILLNW